MTGTTQSPIEPDPPNGNEGGISLLDLAIVLAKRKGLVVGLPFAVALLTLGIAFLIPNSYTAVARILPPQQTQSNAVAILGQLGAIGGVAGSALGVKNPADVFIAMLKSRSVAESVIGSQKLKDAYRKELFVDTQKELARRSNIYAGRDGVIIIEVEDEDPGRSSSVANAYVAALEALTLRLAVTEASQRRLFFENQLKKAKEDLASAEVEVRSFREKTGLVIPDSQAALTVSASAGLRAQITAQEVRLATMRSYATENNPEVIRLESELAGLRTQLARLERDVNVGKGDVLVAIGKAPAAGAEYVRLLREVKYREALFEIFARQYETARIDEAKNATLIQVLDEAVPPERKSKPKRALMAIFAGLVAGVIAVVWAFVLEARDRARADPDKAGRLALLRAHLRWR